MWEFWYYHVSLLFFVKSISRKFRKINFTKISWNWFHEKNHYFSLFSYYLPYCAWNSKAVTIWNHLFTFFLHYKQISFVYIFAVYDNTRTVCALCVLFLFWVFRVSRIILNWLFFLYPHITLLGCTWVIRTFHRHP